MNLATEKGCKEQSRDKWRKIVEDLERNKPELVPTFGANTCGYCFLYLDGQKAVPQGSRACVGCVLMTYDLCHGGIGDAYRNTILFYCRLETNQYQPGLFRLDFCEERDKARALAGARAILAAIEKDIQESRKEEDRDNLPAVAE